MAINHDGCACIPRLAAQVFGETREARIQPCSKRDKVFVGWSHLQAVSSRSGLTVGEGCN